MEYLILPFYMKYQLEHFYHKKPTKRNIHASFTGQHNNSNPSSFLVFNTYLGSLKMRQPEKDVFYERNRAE